jgi:hypothetical protein
MFEAGLAALRVAVRARRLRSCFMGWMEKGSELRES